jgi:hypothetical protein
VVEWGLPLNELVPACEPLLCDPAVECEPPPCELVAECEDECEPDELRANTPGAVQTTTAAITSAASRIATPPCGDVRQSCASPEGDALRPIKGAGNREAGRSESWLSPGTKIAAAANHATFAE